MKKIAALCTALVCLVFAAQSQSPDSPTDIMVLQSPVSDVLFDDTVGDTLSDPALLFEENEDMSFSVSMLVSDTVNIQTIYVKVGSAQGGNDVADVSFSFDGTPGSGLTYLRDGYSIVLGVGNHTILEDYYCEVYVEDASGNASAVASYSTN